MKVEEFRRHGHQVIDWIADYLQTIQERPVLAQVEPGEIRAALPAHPPQDGEPFDAVLADLDRVIMPGITHWQHPSFFAYFPANASGPAILGDLLSSGLGVQGMLWATSPACTELEQVTLDWLAELLGLPATFRSDGAGGGVIQDTASTAVLVALLAALHRVSGGTSARDGVGAGRFTAYASAEAHSSVQKAVRMAGLGDAALRTIATDPATLALSPAALREQLALDRAAGHTPALIVATIGTTSTTAIDPVPEIGAIARAENAWLHVDAAYAGVAAVCPEFRWILDGVAEFADSFGTNPHKWLLTNFDCHTFWVADRAALTGALSILPEYLRNTATDSGAVVDFRDWHVQLGRRFRALKLWSVIRCYGVSGLRQHIRDHVAMAQEFAGWVAADNRFELTAPHPLSLVCFRLVDEDSDRADRRNTALLETLNSGGTLYLTHTRIAGRVSLRLAVGGTYTERRHVAQAWQAIERAAA
jgi:aromatic-L-amino-acid decarboxylase